MIGRNLETQAILTRLATDMGEHLTGQFTIPEMQALAEKYGEEDFQKAISDPAMLKLLDESAKPETKMALDQAIISKYFNVRRDLVRAFDKKLDDPLRLAAEKSFLKGFYAGATKHAERAGDAVAGANRMVMTDAERQAAIVEMDLAKAAMKAAIVERFGKDASETSDVQAMLARVDAGEFTVSAEDYPELVDVAVTSESLFSKASIKKAILDRAYINEAINLTAGPRPDKHIPEYMIHPDVDKPAEQDRDESLPSGRENAFEGGDKDSGEAGRPVMPEFLRAVVPETDEERAMSREELVEKREKERAESKWRGIGGRTEYVTPEGDTVRGSDIIHSARGFIAQAFRTEIEAIKPKMAAEVTKAVEEVGKILASAIEMSPEAEARVLAPSAPVIIDTSAIDDKWADKPKGFKVGAAKIESRDQAETFIDKAIDSQDKVLYSFAQAMANTISQKSVHYNNWANDISREINKYQGGESHKELPPDMADPEAKATGKKRRGRPMVDPSLRPAEREFRRYMAELNWSPLADLVIQQHVQKAAPAKKEGNPTGYYASHPTETFQTKHTEYMDGYYDAIDKIRVINHNSNAIYDKMERAKSHLDMARTKEQAVAPRKEYYALKLQFNKLMGELMLAMSEAEMYAPDPLTYDYRKTLTQGGHSDTQGNPLIYFVNTMFNAQAETEKDLSNYLEMRDGRAMVRADVLKREFMEFFQVKMTITLYEAMLPEFRRLVEEKVQAAYDGLMQKVYEVGAEAETDRSRTDDLLNKDLMQVKKDRTNKTNTFKDQQIYSGDPEE